MRLRRIDKAVETILSNIELFASVRTMAVAGPGKRLLMELRAPVALSALTLAQLRGYIARKLEAVLGLRLRAEQVFLVSLPSAGAPTPAEPGSVELARTVQGLPLWSSVVAPGAVAPPTAPAANDPTLGAPAADAARLRPVPANAPKPAADKDFFASDPRYMGLHQGGLEVAEFTASQISEHFQATQPLSLQELPAKIALTSDEQPPAGAKAAS